MPTVDAHQHFWDLDRFDYPWMSPDLTVLRRNYLPNDLAPLLRAAGVDRSVFVQCLHKTEENRWVLDLADRHDFIAGVVGWVDLASADEAAQVEEFEGHPKFVGVRHLVHDEPNDDWLLRDDVIRGLAKLAEYDLAFDLLLRPRHLKHVATLAAKVPDLRMVIDHLAKPLIAQRRFDGWLDDLRAAAAFDNVFCKLSGMITEADHATWKPADLRPYVRHALDLFGPRRLMFGSDWPVCLLAGSYAQVHAALVEALGPISEGEREQIFGDTATRFYGLG